MNVSILTPGFLVFLVEQSELYFDLFRLQEASNVVNNVINHLISENYDVHRMKAKDRWYICIIQYNNEAQIVTSGFLSDLDENPASFEKKEMTFSDGVGGYFKQYVDAPLWISPVFGKKQVNMKSAFIYAEELINQWILERPNTPTPLIINISSGIPYYEGKEVSGCREDVIDIVNRIKNYDIHIFNLILGGKENVVFPLSNNEIYDEKTRFVYELSTGVPSNFNYPYNRWRNKEYGTTLIDEGAKLLCNNNIVENLMSFIDCQYCPHTGQYDG